jgi:hypothetical protein
VREDGTIFRVCVFQEILFVHFGQATDGLRGPGGNLPCFRCRSTLNHEVTQCVHFVGWRPDQAVTQGILRAIEGCAVQAAIEAAERVAQQDAEWQQALKLEPEQARYEATLAERRYEAVDPAQRLVASELEARSNRALERVQMVEKRSASLCM